MSNLNETSTLNIKINVKPVFFHMHHINAYMGPCRYGEGYALSTEFDIAQGNEVFELFKKELVEQLDMRNVNLLEPVTVIWNEDFVVTEKEIQKAIADDCETDVYLMRGTRVAGYFGVMLSQRTNKPIAHIPPTKHICFCDHVDMTARLWALGKPGYAFMDFEDANRTFAVLKTKKALANTKVFFPLKAAVLSPGCQSSYLTLEQVTDRFGVRFEHVNSEDVFKCIDELTPEEKQSAVELAEKLAKEAKGMHMPVEYLVNDTTFYTAVKKMMAHRSCNAFTIPCFEVCATMELQKRKMIFCLTHSLLKDEGIASACAGDVGSVLSLTILMNLARKAPHMGNATVLDRATNQCRVLHDVACSKMKGYDEPSLPIEYVSFTLGNWGGTMRYDFAQDAGHPITLINLSPDLKKMVVAKGEINGCDNYLVPECKHAVRFTVKDATRFHKCERHVGHHFSWVYGDYSGILAEFGQECGLEILEA